MYQLLSSPALLPPSLLVFLLAAASLLTHLNPCLSLTLSLSLAHSHAHSTTLLVVFRPRSAHTSTLQPSSEWTLPIVELQQCMYHRDVLPCLTPLRIDPITLCSDMTPVQWINYDCMYYWTVPSASIAAIALAAKRCILLHGLHEIIYEGDITALSPSSLSNPDLAQTHPLVEALARYRGRPYTIATSFPSDPHYAQQQVQANYVRPLKMLLSRSSQTYTHEPPSDCTNYHIFSDKTRLILSTAIARGKAASLYGHQGNRDPLPSLRALRRPLIGVLKTLATKDLPHQSSTYIEPEIGLLLCNLAGITKESNSSVLDPFCGMCSLLSYASYAGATTTTGVDISHISLNTSRITANYNHINTSLPTALYIGSAYDLLMNSVSDSSLFSRVHPINTTTTTTSTATTISDYEVFDTILTDPPYGMQEAIIGCKYYYRHLSSHQFINYWCAAVDRSSVNSSLGLESRSKASESATSLVLQLSSRVLKQGGRTVFFVPHVKGASSSSSSVPLPELPAGSILY
jgi:16S rRNA G966 N2-methylase RsmD